MACVELGEGGDADPNDSDGRARTAVTRALDTGLGEHDAAIEWLERAYAERAGAIYGIRGSFLFAPLREKPRFGALLRKMHLA